MFLEKQPALPLICLKKEKQKVKKEQKIGKNDPGFVSHLAR